MKRKETDGSSNGQTESAPSGTEPNEPYYAVMPIGIHINAPNLASARAQMVSVAKGLSVLPSLQVEYLRAYIYQDHTQVFPALKKEDACP